MGGGLATIPFLMQMSEKHPHWFTVSELANMIAVSESTPGPIGINMATYVGYAVAGIPGAIVSTASLIAPAFLSMLVIVRALQKYRNNRYVNAGFEGLRPAVTGLIAAAGYAVLKLAIFSESSVRLPSLLLFVVLFACTQLKRFNLHPLAYIAVAAAVGVLFSL